MFSDQGRVSTVWVFGSTRRSGHPKTLNPELATPKSQAIHPTQKEIFIKLMTSDRKLKAEIKDPRDLKDFRDLTDFHTPGAAGGRTRGVPYT